MVGPPSSGSGGGSGGPGCSHPPDLASLSLRLDKHLAIGGGDVRRASADGQFPFGGPALHLQHLQRCESMDTAYMECISIACMPSNELRGESSSRPLGFLPSSSQASLSSMHSSSYGDEFGGYILGTSEHQQRQQQQQQFPQQPPSPTSPSMQQHYARQSKMNVHRDLWQKVRAVCAVERRPM